MGYDLYGTRPVSMTGDYWRSGLTTWPMLWGFVCEVSPAAAAQGPGAFTSDGHIVSPADAEQIAGDIDRHVREVGLPDPGGPIAGAYLAEALVEAGYPMDVAASRSYVTTHLTEFADFCRNSGGFCIY